MSSLKGLYNTYETNKSAEENGVWYEDSGVCVKLARMGGANTRYQKALTAAMKPHLREINLGLADDATIEKKMRKVFINTIMLEWDATEEDGLSIPLNENTVGALFDALPDFYVRLRDFASSYANYRAAELEAAAGN